MSLPEKSPDAPPSSAARMAQGLAEAAQALLRAANAILDAEGLTGSVPVPAPSADHGVTRSRSADSGAPGRFDVRTVREAINEFLVVKARARVSDRYLRTLRVSLVSFAQGRAHALLHDVTATEIEKWIYGLKVRPRTMKGYLGDVRTLYHWCQRMPRLPFRIVFRSGFAPARLVACSTIEIGSIFAWFSKRSNSRPAFGRYPTTQPKPTVKI